MLQTGFPSLPGAGFIVVLLLCRGWVCGAELPHSQGDAWVSVERTSYSGEAAELHGGGTAAAATDAMNLSAWSSAWSYRSSVHSRGTSASSKPTPDSVPAPAESTTELYSTRAPQEQGAPSPPSTPVSTIDVAAPSSRAVASRTLEVDVPFESLPGDARLSSAIHPTMVFSRHYGVFSTALPADEASAGVEATAGGGATARPGDSTPALQEATWKYSVAASPPSSSLLSWASGDPGTGASEEESVGPGRQSIGPKASDNGGGGGGGAAAVAPTLSSGTVPSWTDTKLITTATAHTDGPAAHFHWLLRRADIAWIVTAITVVVATSVLGGVLCVSRRRKEASHERNLSYWNEAITLDYFRHAVQLPQDLPYGAHPTVATISLDEMALPEEDGGLTFVNTFAKGVTFADGHRSTEL